MITTIMFILNFIAFLVAVGLLITLHEWGHFWVARRANIKVTRFSIGFGKAIKRYIDAQGTEYVIGWLPLGGYVKMLDSREEKRSLSPHEQQQAFDKKPRLIRAAVIAAGPLINLLLGLFLYSTIFFVGIERVIPMIGAVLPQSIAAQAGLQPQTIITSIDNQKVGSWGETALAIALRLGEKGHLLIGTQSPKTTKKKTHTLSIDHWSIDPLNPRLLESLGIKPFHPPIPTVIGKIEKRSPAERSGLKAGDRIITVNGKKANDWIELIQFVHKRPNEWLTFKIQRQNQRKTINVPSTWAWGKGWKIVGHVGVKSQAIQWPPALIKMEKYSLGKASLQSLRQTKRLIYFNSIIIAKLLRGQLSLSTLGGPISIFKISGQAWQQGLLIYMEFLATISILLGCINLLPIPALDGGHLLFLAIEGIRRKPLSPALEQLFVRLGFILLIVLMFQATVNDVLRFAIR